MRAAANETADQNYVQMFLRTANVLEEHAERVAHDPKSAVTLAEEIALHAPVNLLC